MTRIQELLAASVNNGLKLSQQLLRDGSHGPVRGSQHTGSRRCLPAGDDFVLMAYLEAAVGVFHDFHLHSRHSWDARRWGAAARCASCT